MFACVWSSVLRPLPAAPHVKTLSVCFQALNPNAPGTATGRQREVDVSASGRADAFPRRTPMNDRITM